MYDYNDYYMEKLGLSGGDNQMLTEYKKMRDTSVNECHLFRRRMTSKLYNKNYLELKKKKNTCNVGRI